MDEPFALFGKGTPEQDEIAALLANTNESEWQTLNRYLEQLAEMQQFDRQVALRKWRLVELIDLSFRPFAYLLVSMRVQKRTRKACLTQVGLKSVG